MVAWAGRTCTVEVETSEGFQATDIMGRPIVTGAKDGRARVELTQMPVYISGLAPRFVSRAKDEAPWPRRKPGSVPFTASRVWTALEFVEPRGKPSVDQVLAERDAFVCREQTVQMAVRVYNYTDKTVPVHVRLEVPDGWAVEGGDSAEVTVQAMGQERITFTVVRTGQAASKEGKVTAHASSPSYGKDIPPSVGYIRAE